MIRVLKFGGTALKTNDSIKLVTNVITNNLDHKLLVIVSAMGRYPDAYATDTLNALALNANYDEHCRLLSCGEIISSIVLSSNLKSQGINAISLSSMQLNLKVKHNRLVGLDTKVINKYFETYDVIIVPGFQGIDKFKNIRILEKGDSDYTAAYLARRLNLDEVYIYSDVCGIFTGDPKYINEARLIKHIGYRQALDLAKHKARIICYKALMEGYKKDGFKIKLRSFKDDRIGTLINHDDTNIRTMSINFNYWLIRFEETIAKSDYSFLHDCFDDDYLIFEEDLAKLETDYTKIDLYTKVHFVGCGLENDEIYRNFLEKFAIVSKNEHDSYYVKAKNQKQDLNLLHDLVVRSD